MPMERIQKSLQLFSESKARKLTISGGGEPMDAPEQVMYLFEHIPEGNCIELHSCGLSWAGTVQRATAFFDEIEKRIQGRFVEARIRMSIGKFIQNKVPLSFAIHAIQAYELKAYSFRLFFNTAYLKTDDTISIMQRELKCQLSEISSDLRRQNLITEKHQYTIRFSNLAEPHLVLSEDEYNQFLNRDGIVLTIDDKVAPLRNEDGDYVMGMSFNDVCGEGLLTDDGLALTVDTNGDIWLFLGSVPDRNASVDTQNFEDICSYFEQDPITWVFMTQGVERVARAASVFRPELFQQVQLRNDPVTYIFEALFTAELRWGTTLVLLYDLIQSNVIILSDLPEYLHDTFALPKTQFLDFVQQQYQIYNTQYEQYIPPRQGTGGRGPTDLFVPSSALRHSLTK